MAKDKKKVNASEDKNKKHFCSPIHALKIIGCNDLIK